MPCKWIETTIGELAPFTYGRGLRENERDNTGSVPVFGSNGIVGFHNEPITKGPTIIIGRKGTVGTVHYSPVPCWPIDTTFYVTGDDPQIVRFKYYLLKFLGLEHMNADSAVPGLNRSAAHSRQVKVPPLPIQRAIAHILGTLDDKIELNRQMNATLEALARALFKSWFVDFDPVRAKAEGRQPAGMDAETAALFPDAFVDSELGKIPRGWRVSTLGDVIEVTKGRSYSSSELQPSATALVTLKSFRRGGGYRSDGLKPFTGTYKPEQIIRPGDLIISYTDVTQDAEVIGKPAIVIGNPSFTTLVASLDVGIIRPQSDNVSIPFLYLLLLTDDFQAHIYGYTSGTTVLHLDGRGIAAYRFVSPSMVVARKFREITEPLIAKIQNNEAESFTLAALRDTLLPKLISGEVRVRDAERLVS